MFANTQMMGIDFAFPDVCLTPPVAIPIPYPNFGLGPIGIPPAFNILWMCCPAHNMLTFVPITLGDQPGVMLGVASGMVMGPDRHITAAFTVLVLGIPGTRMTSLTLQNNTNMVGMRIVPSQIKVILLAA